MGALDAGFIRGFIRMANDGWEQGWHERNGGNLSYRLTKKDIKTMREYLKPRAWVPTEVIVPDLGGDHLLVTAAGSYFRNIIDEPKSCMGIIEIDATGENYRPCWGFAGDGTPTSELPTHLLNQAVKKRVSDGACRVLYHAHPVNTIALTFVLPQDGYTFTRELWRMISECAMVFPAGVGVVPWMVPGSSEIAVASAQEMERRDIVVWAHHGVFCAGVSFDETFGLMHTVEKAAEIMVKVRSMHSNAWSTITDENLDDLARAYGLELS